MTTTKMTIHRALSELKLIDAKIEKTITEIEPVQIHQKDKKINGYLTVEEFSSNATSKYQQVQDLIARKVKIKSAIVKANGQTTVKIGEKTMTISDAITFKAVVDLKNKLIMLLKQKQNFAISQVNKNNEIVQKNVDIMLQNAYGKDSTKVSKDDQEAIAKPYLEYNQWHLVDPLKLAEKISQLEKEVGDFQAEVDAVLSEINSITFIEI